MTAVGEVDQLIEQYQLALDEFMKGNPEPVQELFSHREDVTRRRSEQEAEKKALSEKVKEVVGVK